MNGSDFRYIVLGKGPVACNKLNIKSYFLMHFPPQTRTISVVSEETKKQLDQMILQNKELEGLLSKTRSDNDAKVCFRLSTNFFCHQ